jgi:hypothetical protein
MHTKSIALDSNLKWYRLARLGLLLVLALLIPSLGLPQAITGPLVNALLILTVEIAGLGAALAIGMVTPMAALLRGVLPLPLMVMIPFIALGNATLAGARRRRRGQIRPAFRRGDVARRAAAQPGGRRRGAAGRAARLTDPDDELAAVHHRAGRRADRLRRAGPDQTEVTYEPDCRDRLG